MKKITELSQKILQLLYPCRRQSHACLKCLEGDYAECMLPHQKKIQRLIELQRPIEFVLPAFPAKSPNANKTIGPLPDLGERLALRFLDKLCNQITAIYPPGAEIIICSDGRVFNDVVQVSDVDVGAYTSGVNAIIREEMLTHVRTFGLESYYDSIPFAAMRERLVAEYGEPLLDLKNKIKEDAAEKNLFNGMHRFIFEDHLALVDSVSRNRVRNMAKEATYLVIQRSHAWSRFVEKNFPDAVRLSIHPQICGSHKLGIMLLKSKDVWATPWHRIVLFDGREHLLVRRIEAEAMGAQQVFANNQFSHYVM